MKSAFEKILCLCPLQTKGEGLWMASQLAKEVDKGLPKEAKRHGVFGQLTGFIHQSLQGGKSKEMVVEAI